jgi:hypothetical protein
VARCAVLGESLSDADSLANFVRACAKYEQDDLDFDQFLSWMARRNGIENNLEEFAEEETVELIEGAEILQHQLESSLSGEYGDVHFQDLTTVLGKRNLDIAKQGLSGKGPTPLQKLQGLTNKAKEKYRMVKDAFRFTTRQNSSFPLFTEDQLVKFVQVMVKQEYFVGQEIISQVRVATHRSPYLPLRQLHAERCGLYT